MMAPKVLFDSSAVILYFNDALPLESVTLMQRAIVEGTGAMSVITRAEVLAWPSHTPASIEAALSGMGGFEVFDVTRQVADEAARIRRECNLKLPDALIAATAQLLRIPVFTANQRDFERVKDLVVIGC